MRRSTIIDPATGKSIKVIKCDTQKEFIDYTTTHLSESAKNSYLKSIGFNTYDDIDYDYDDDDDQWGPGFNVMHNMHLMQKLIKNGRLTYAGRL